MSVLVYVTVESDVDGLCCMCRECVGRVCNIVGSGQTLEYPVIEGLPLSWIVKLIVFGWWWLCVVGVVGGLRDCVCDTRTDHVRLRGILLYAYRAILKVWK